MQGIDTNILIRYIVQDDAVQSALAGELIEKRFTPENPAHINRIVLCELVWVLSAAYGFERSEIARALRQILLTDSFRVEDHSVAWEALGDYAAGGADYADLLIGRGNRDVGVETTLTFDRKAAAGPHFTLVGA